MTKEQSIALSGYINKVITEACPTVEFNDEILKKAEENYSADKLKALSEIGIYDGNFEKFYVVKKFCDKIKLWNYADSDYIKALFSEAVPYKSEVFSQDKYLRNIKVPEKIIGNNILTNAFYEKGEFFQYDMPNMNNDIVVPKLGYFDRKITFPSVYEGNIPWVSVCPSEINSMKPDIEKAHGRCLVLGLGLGYYPYIISGKNNVKSITIIEINPRIIEIFNSVILPQFENRDKIKIICADAVKYIESIEREEYDFCFADIWEGQADGAELYIKIKEYEKKLPYTEFTYWIEEQLVWYMENII